MKDLKQSCSFQLGMMRQILAFIAEKGWVESPPLAEYPLLIVRASQAFGESYTTAHLEQFYGSMRRRASLPPFEEMTAERFLEAMRPAIIQEVA